MTGFPIVRQAEDVVRELFASMAHDVTSYDDGAVRVGGFIDGTAFFPGGAGLWRGSRPGGVLPELFPERPLMIVGHNFDSVRGHERSMRRRIELLRSGTWKYLLAFLETAAIAPERCFFTNALVGLQPGKATGRMRAGVAYHDECRAFLAQQIANVQPRCIAALGVAALEQVHAISCALPVVPLLHPGALRFVKGAEREAVVQREAGKLRNALS